MNRLLGILICAFVVATACITVTITQRQQVLRHVAHHNDAWAIGQSVTEFMRLEALLAAYNIPERTVPAEDIRLRLDIIVSRLASLSEGPIKDLLKSSDTHRKTVEQASSLIRELDGGFESMSRTQLLELLGRMYALNGPLIQLSSYSVQQGWADIDENLNALHDLHRVSALVVMLLVAAWCILVALQLVRNRQLKVTQGQAASLNADLIKTSEELREKNRSLEYTAYHDTLTDLPNRSLFWKETEALLEECKSSDQAAYVLLIDLDDFKTVNDTLGHDVGDLLLTQVGDRLLAFKDKVRILSRLGGDEFACAVKGQSEADVQGLAERITENLAAPYFIGSRKVRIGCSIGISGAARDQGLSAKNIFKQADLALYHAKTAAVRNCIVLFEDHMLSDFDDRKALEQDLREAVVRNQFEVLYQAQVDIMTLELWGLEALVRWRHPTRGTIGPHSFIPLAESMGLIGELGKLVLESACKEAMRWKQPLKVAVNISPLQLLEHGFVSSVAKVLHDTGLPAHRLELEITETVLLDKRDSVIAALDHLRSLGLTVALDDFGTGYSSLAILRDIPFDTLKLDKSFVRDIATDEMAATLVRLVVDMGSRLGKTVIVEGVETRVQHEKIREIGGLLSQGFLFARPVKSEKLAFLREEGADAGLIEDFVH